MTERPEFRIRGAAGESCTAGKQDDQSTWKSKEQHSTDVEEKRASAKILHQLVEAVTMLGYMVSAVGGGNG